MIDKIDSNYSYNYGKITKHTTNTGSFEKIRKNYEKNGVVYEKNEQKSGANHPQETLYKAREEEAKVQHAAGLTFEQIKESLRSMIAFLKETWRMIWEDTPKSEDTVGKEQPENEKSNHIAPKSATNFFLMDPSSFYSFGLIFTDAER